MAKGGKAPKGLLSPTQMEVILDDMLRNPAVLKDKLCRATLLAFLLGMHASVETQDGRIIPDVKTRLNAAIAFARYGTPLTEGLAEGSTDLSAVEIGDAIAEATALTQDYDNDPQDESGDRTPEES